MRASRRPDVGVTLIELLIVMFLTSILGTIVMFAMSGIYASQRTADTESTGLADVRTVNERLGRDLRDARGVYPGATESELEIWIDYDSDYIVDSAEIITWQLQQGCTDCHYQVLRSEQGGEPRVQARTLVSDIAFCYSTSVATDPPTCTATPISSTLASSVKVVTVTVTYNAADTDSDDVRTRTTTFTQRLRNVA